VIDEHARGEQVENEIDAMIRRRHDARVIQEGERPAHEAWMESEKRHDARRREENRAAWCEYHTGHAERHRAVLESLISRHEAEIVRLQAKPTTGEHR
jgi:hypothetical protein